MHTEQRRLKVWQGYELEEKKGKRRHTFQLLTERVGHLYKHRQIV